MATILVFTTMPWPFPAQLAAAFSACGARVEALSPAHGKLARSRHVARHHAWHLLTPHAGIDAALNSADLVIPCDDLAAELLLARQGEAPLSRHEFLTRAAKAGAPVADAMPLDDAGALDTAIAQLGLPLVIKCDATWGGDGVAIVHTRQHARAAVDGFRKQSRLRHLVRALRRKRAHFLSRALFPVRTRISAQRFVAGHPATSTLACWQGQVVAAHHFDVVQSSGATGPASVIAVTDCAQMQASAEAVAKAFNLSGLVGLDYIRGADGRVHLLEMNARAVPTSHLALHHDPVFALLAAAGLQARPRASTTALDHIALFPREWLRDPLSHWLKDAFHDVPWDDAAVVRACAQVAPPAALAVLKDSAGPALTSKSALFRA
jgi:hypothetical protein